MSKTILAILAAVAAALGLFAQTAHAGQMDLMLRKMVTGMAKGPDVSWSKAAHDKDGVLMLPCFVKTTDADATSRAIVDRGGRASRVAGGDFGESILSAMIPYDSIEGIASRDEVIVVEAAAVLSPKMDTARYASDTVSVQDGTALGLAYDGTDVVVGVVDDGLDFGNADFTDADGVTRVQYLRETVAGEVVECIYTSIVDGSCTLDDGGQGTTHGTHVTGIAGGSDSVYTGIAPAADLMFVFNDATDASTSDSGATSLATAVVDGVTAIFGKADELDKPCVANLSLGTSVGAHDGTSLLEQGLTDLTTDKRGRIIVNAAGNEQVTPAAQPASRRDYVGGIHASIDVPAGESRGYRIGVWNGVTAEATYVGGSMADVWLGTGQKDDCQIAAFAYTQGRASSDFTFPGLATTDDASFATADVPFAVDTTSSVTADDGTVQVAIDVDDSDARNQKPHATATFSSMAGGLLSSDLETRWYDVVVRSTGAACSGHMWLYYDAVSVHDFLKGIAGAGLDVGDGATYVGYSMAEGDSQYTATIPSTAVGVISAGSWMPQKPVDSGVSEWTGDNGTTYDQSDLTAPGGTGSVTGDLSAFSSLGPTADGRTKPAVVAPGEPIISTKATGSFVSSSIRVRSDHYKSAGTSMSSPHVAGIVALLLQRNNTLNVDEVRTALAVGATTDGLTSKSPDPANSYGAGKVMAAQVLASVGEDTSAYSGTGNLGENGGGGSGGSDCGLMAGRAPLPALWIALLMTACALGAIAFSKKYLIKTNS